MTKALVKVDENEPKRRFSWWWVAAIACIVTAVLLVPLDLLSFSVPQWLVWVLVGLVALTVALVWRRAHGKQWTKTLLTVFGVLAILCVIAGSVFNPYWNSVSLRATTLYAQPYDAVLTTQQARHDLDAALSHIEKIHPALLDGVPAETRKAYEQAAQALETRVDLTTSEVAASVESVLSTLKDGHTYVQLNYETPHYMKFWDQNDPRALVAVNGTSLDTLLEQHAGKISADTTGWAQERLLSTLSSREGLAYLGIDTSAPVTYTYDTSQGTVDVVAHPADFLPWSEYAEFNGISEEGSADSEELAHYEIYPDQSLAVLTLDLCRNDGNYQSTLQDMFDEVRDQGIRNVAVDLRENSGGDSSVIAQFLQYVAVDTYKTPVPDWRLGPILVQNDPQTIQNPKVQDAFDGNVYVLSSPRTFSSAMMFAQVISDNGIGEVIGEAPGNDPNGYGEVTWVQLPETGLIMQVSTKRWHRIDDQEGLVEPDVAVPAADAMGTLLDVVAGRSQGGEA